MGRQHRNVVTGGTEDYGIAWGGNGVTTMTGGSIFRIYISVILLDLTITTTNTS